MKNILFVSLIALVGCAGFNNAKTKQDVLMKSSIEDDSFRKVSWIKGPPMKASTLTEAAKKDHSDWQVDEYFLRAFVDKKNDSRFIQIYVSHADTDWLFFNSATDSDGNELKFVEISRDTSSATKYGVGVIESFAIEVSLDYLKAHAAKGISIRVYGKNGKRMLNIPSFYVDGFIEKYEAYS